MADYSQLNMVANGINYYYYLSVIKNVIIGILEWNSPGILLA
jgi:hypothetical protein